MTENTEQSVTNTLQLFLDLDEAASLADQYPELEKKAIDRFVGLIESLPQKANLLSKIAEKNKVIIRIPHRAVYIDAKGALYESGTALDPRTLAQQYGAECCIDYLCSAIAERKNAIKKKFDSAVSAIAKANAALSE